MAVKKQGRNKKKAQAIAYKAENRAARNKAKRATKHAKLHPNDVNNKGPYDYKRKKPLPYRFGTLPSKSKGR